MSHGNDDRVCCWCKQKFHISAKGLSWHQKRCAHNPNPEPLPEPKPTPKWTCPSCGKTVAASHKNRHRCAVPTAVNIEQMMIDATKAVMARNDRKRQQRQTTQCPRCRCTPCQTPDSCGKAIRAQAQHAARLAREAAELGRKA